MRTRQIKNHHRKNRTENHLQGSKGQLIGKSQAHLCVLQHVIEAEVLDQIVRAMDFLVRVLKLRFDDEGGWVTEAASGGVVGAGVAALCFDVGDVAVLVRGDG
jgi:hypothetical protein